MNTPLKGTLAVGALTLVLAVVLVSCGGGGGAGGSSAGGGSSAASKATTSGEATTGGTTGGEGTYGSASSAATTTKGASKSASKAASGGVLKTIVIKESEFKLSPSTVTLSKPGTYAFEAQNKGSAEHNLEIDGEGVKSKGGEVGEAKLDRNLDPGESGVLRLIFKESGTYEMYCPIIGHRLAGMKGTVVVK